MDRGTCKMRKRGAEDDSQVSPEELQWWDCLADAVRLWEG